MCAKIFNYNNLRKRNFKRHVLFRGFEGFKIHCLGRFTRKQRARSVWYSTGRVSLNTISSNIDFAFYSLPVVNSTITIRVWLTDNREFKWYVQLF